MKSIQGTPANRVSRMPGTHQVVTIIPSRSNAPNMKRSGEPWIVYRIDLNARAAPAWAPTAVKGRV